MSYCIQLHFAVCKSACHSVYSDHRSIYKTKKYLVDSMVSWFKANFIFFLRSFKTNLTK